MIHILVNKVLTQVDPLEGSCWFNRIENRCVAQTWVGPKIWVSTVFLGVDHGYGDVPLWFETMVFKEDCADKQKRYETWDLAGSIVGR
jgi:hypothetical protein